MIRKTTIVTAAFVGLCGLSSAQAADLIEGYVPPPRHHARVIAPVVAYVDCSLLRVDYRAPNPPRSEIVQVCYPPLDLSIRSSINRRGQFIGAGY